MRTKMKQLLVSVLVGCTWFAGVAMATAAPQPENTPLILGPSGLAPDSATTRPGYWVQNPIPPELFEASQTIAYDPKNDEYTYNIQGSRNGEAFSFTGVFDLSDPSNPVRVPPLPGSLPGEDSLTGYYFITALDGDDIDSALLGNDFPEGAGMWTDSIEIEFSAATGTATAAPDPDLAELLEGFPYEVTTKIETAGMPRFYKRDGTEIGLGQAVESLRKRGLTYGEIQDWLGRKTTGAEFTRQLEDGAKRVLKNAGLTDVQIDELKRLFDATYDADQLRYGEAAREMLRRFGLSIAEIQDLASADGDGAVQFGGDGLQVTVSASVSLSVAVPPFTAITVTATVSLSGNERDFLALQARVNAMAAVMADKLAAAVRAQVERVKREFRDWIDGVYQDFEPYLPPQCC